jgi:hypothetical protein
MIYKYYPYNIDLDLVAKWLNTKKGKLKETLLLSYEKDVDYIIIDSLSADGKRSHNDKSHDGQNKETILLHPDTFKMMCMRSRKISKERVERFIRNNKMHRI